MLLLAENTVQNAQETWIDTFRQLMHYYVPPLESTAEVNVGGIVAVAFGLFLVFRGGRYERHVVTGFALVLGGYLGHLLAGLINAPGPITVALCSVALAAIAYKTFNWWLAIGSVIVLFAIGLTFQLGHGDLKAYLPQDAQYSKRIENDKISLASPEQQVRNLNADWRTQLSRIGENMLGEVRKFDFASWIIPVAMAVLGAVLAYWALRTFAIFWLGFIGANISVLGACTIICANSDLRDSMFAKPHVPAFIVLGIWVLGLIWQAREARFPKKPAPSADGGESKS